MTDETLTARVGAALTKRRERVAVAESSTGGLLSSMLTDVPGSSAYFDRGVVSYSNTAKVESLGVRPQTLVAHGAVSEPTAREMALGVCKRSETDWGVSTTGIAGPGGGSPEKPVGTVYIGVAHDDGERFRAVSTTHHVFSGSRDECKQQFAEQALSELLEQLSVILSDVTS